MSPQLSVVVSLLLVSSAIFGFCSAENILYTNQRLYAGKFLTNGNYRFTMQRDCNLVLSDGTTTLWSTRTAGKGSFCSVSMQSDGNLVLNSGTTRLWASSKISRPNGDFVSVLLSDGNVVIYDRPIWSTKIRTVGTPGDIISANSADTAAPEETNATPDIAMVVNN